MTHPTKLLWLSGALLLSSVPAVYAEDEGVQNTHVVLWYIAHIGSVALPAACGPAFRLDGYGAPPPEEPPAPGGGGMPDG